MAAVGRVTSVRLLSAKERNGVIVSLRQEALVVGLTETDHSVLFEALTAAGVPVEGSTLPNASDAYKFLRLVERNPSIVNADPGHFSVELVYESPLTADSQDLDNGDAQGIVYGRMSASVQQITTNLYRPEPGAERIPIVLGHRYPPDEASGQANVYKTQGGQITVMQPQKNFKFSGYVTTDQPWILCDNMVGTVNENPWFGEEPRTWMCMGASWELIGYNVPNTKPRYKLNFEMQHNPDTWDPTVVFIDERSHKPPIGLKRANDPNLRPGDEPGIKDIEYQTAEDWNELLAVLFEEQ